MAFMVMLRRKDYKEKNRKGKSLLFLFLAGILFLFGSKMYGEVDLVKGGQAKAIIVTADDPSPVAAYAAKELAEHVKKATGVTLSVVTESNIPEGNFSRIFIGVTKSAAAQGIQPDKLDNDAFILRTVGNDLFILGKEDKSKFPLDLYHGYSGTMFGVSEILERYLGVRWLWPGKLGTFIPHKDNVSIDKINETVTPRLLLRDIGYNAHRNLFKSGNMQKKELIFDEYPDLYRNLCFSTPEMLKEYVIDLEVFMRRHRLGRSQPDGYDQYRLPMPRHAFHDWWLRYGKEHPEWFALRDDGTRGPKKGEPVSSWGWQYAGMCVSNPELQKFIVEKAWDGKGVLDLSEADVGFEQLCKCPNCLAWDSPKKENPPIFAVDKYTPNAMSDRYARFWKTVYDMAVKRNPDVKVVAFLYHNFFPAPTIDIKLNKNIIAEFVVYGSDGGWYPMTHEEDEWMRQQWMGWRKTGISMILRPNYMLSGYVMPEITTDQIVDFFNFAYKNGMVAAFYDSLRDHWAANGPMSYLHYRMLWDPELKSRQIRKEYFSAFGPAAKLVEKYFDYWENYVHTEKYLNTRPPLRDKDTGIVINWYPMMRRPVGAVVAFPEEVYPPAEKILDQALAAAKKTKLPEFAQRVQFLKDGLEHAKLSARIWQFLEIDSDGMASPPSDPEKLKKARKAMKDLIEFRKSHQDIYIADYISAVEEEKSIHDIQSLFPGSKEIVDREKAFQSRWKSKTVKAPEESNLRLKQSIELPRTGWLFQKDKQRQGDELKWYLPGTADDDWQEIEIAKFWPADYLGIGWYRGKFETPKLAEGSVAYLHFGAVDESCWVWINGIYVGSHNVGTDAWDKPFRLEITDALKPGKNFIAVRVLNVAYAGGIWKPVKLEIYEPSVADKIEGK